MCECLGNGHTKIERLRVGIKRLSCPRSSLRLLARTLFVFGRRVDVGLRGYPPTANGSHSLLITFGTFRSHDSSVVVVPLDPAEEHADCRAHDLGAAQTRMFFQLLEHCDVRRCEANRGRLDVLFYQTWNLALRVPLLSKTASKVCRLDIWLQPIDTKGLD